MRAFPTAQCFLFALLMSICWLDAGAQSAAGITEQLQKAALPLAGADDTSNNETYSKLFAGHDLIALGESTHGTREFEQFKFGILKGLINKGELKSLALEFDYCGIENLNDYLLSGKNDSLLTAMNRSGFYGIYRTQDMYELLAWIHQYNQKQQMSNRVRLYGVDMQDPYAITQSILNRFKHLAQLDALGMAALKKLNSLYAPRKEIKISKADMAVYKIMTADLTRIAPGEQFAEARLYIRLLEQTLSLREVRDFNTYRSLRDKYMAENALHIFNSRPQDTKMAIWLHNGHIAHAKLDGTYRAGYHLNEALQNRYFALAFAFAEGTVRIYDAKETHAYKGFLYPPSTKSNSVEYTLRNISYPAFLLNIVSLKNAGSERLFQGMDYMRVIGAEHFKNDSDNFFKMPLTDCFDGILFLQKTSASVSLTVTK